MLPVPTVVCAQPKDATSSSTTATKSARKKRPNWKSKWCDLMRHLVFLGPAAEEEPRVVFFVGRTIHLTIQRLSTAHQTFVKRRSVLAEPRTSEFGGRPISRVFYVRKVGFLRNGVFGCGVFGEVGFLGEGVPQNLVNRQKLRVSIQPYENKADINLPKLAGLPLPICYSGNRETNSAEARSLGRAFPVFWDRFPAFWG